MKMVSFKQSQFGLGFYLLSFLLLVFVASAVASFFYLNGLAKYDKEYIRLAGDQRILTEIITRKSLQLMNGDQNAFPGLQRTHLQFETNLNYLRDGNPEIGLPPTNGSGTLPRLQTLESQWAAFKSNIITISESRELVQGFTSIRENLTEVFNDLQNQSEQLSILLVSNNASAIQIHLASQQELLLSRLSFNNHRFLIDNKTTRETAKQFRSDFEQFGKVVDAMLKGSREMNIPQVTQPGIKAKLTEINDIYQPAFESVQKMLIDSLQLMQAQAALDALLSQSDQVLDAASFLMTAYSQSGDTRLIRDYTGLTLGAAALLIIVWLGIKIHNETKLRLQQTALQNQRNQDAIMRLLDEICDLANGDLTTQATVTEDITGAIADAINYTIEQLRTLVSSINKITVQVSSAAKSTQATALHLAEASDQQAHQISAASEAVNQMALSIDTVSDNANESSSVANQSMEIAKTGASAVQDTIRGMDTLREQIQETSKRIKRLGESSQEIGDMVELINDIADQTNILALNAAIQAAMAGKSGRGFAIVADEVQHLAEKSTDATLQIENLVRTIQSDTNEAVASMEQSISEVVSGAKLALNAGEALSEIENVSTHLAKLTQAISKSAQQQANVSSSISESMNVIQNVTSQTAAGTSTTSQAISVLADLSNELRKSVSGFKLPGQ